MVERELIERAKKGEKERFCELVTLHKVRLHGFCYRLSQEPDEAQDLAQETFIQAYRKIHLYQPSGSFLSWLFRIAYRLFLNLAEKKKRRFLAAPLLEESLEFTARINAEPPNGSEGSEAQVRYVLAQMDESYRQPLLLRYHEGLSPDTIATTMGLSPLAVKSRLYRGKHLLAKALKALQSREEHHAL